MKKTNKKGFTLAELLVVVAIIAVLVAIAIPIFTSQLEKAKEATDAANIRSAYAELVSQNLTDGKAGSKTVAITQGTDGWDSDITLPDNLVVDKDAKPIHDGSATVAITADGKATLTYSADKPSSTN